MSLQRVTSLVMPLALLVGCGDSQPADPVPDARASPADAATSPVIDAAPGSADAAPQPLATLSGQVWRSVAPSAGGIGNLYIALFEVDPVTAQNPPAPIAQALIENADLSGQGARVPYQITGITPRPQPYFIVAFLDDNHNASMDPATAGPDMGDLVSLDGLASPSVTVDEPGTVSEDIELNLAMPF